jgi:hypothetical protein
MPAAACSRFRLGVSTSSTPTKPVTTVAASGQLTRRPASTAAATTKAARYSEDA